MTRDALATPVRATATLPELDDADFEFIRSFVRERSSIVLDDGKQYLVQSRLLAIVRDEGLASFAELAAALRRLPRGPLATSVVEAMTTNETSFFRDVQAFEAIVDHLVPAMTRAASSRSITIWCAAASSGQEPYSIAMGLLERQPAVAKSVRIIATDLATSMVARCREGRYSALEVNRGLPARHLVRYFEQDGRDWVIRPEVRSMVETHALNLAGAWTGVPRCDIVLVRNVLIYFSPETKATILQRIRSNVLVPGGYLFLGSSETTLGVDDTFVRRDVGQGICYQTPEL